VTGEGRSSCSPVAKIRQRVLLERSSASPRGDDRLRIPPAPFRRDGPQWVVGEGMAGLRPEWRGRLGPDHVLEIGALAAICGTAMTEEVDIATHAGGLPNTFVPERNIIFTLAGALAHRSLVQSGLAQRWRNHAGPRVAPSSRTDGRLRYLANRRSRSADTIPARRCPTA
jgi:hypothetical protein